MIKTNDKQIVMAKDIKAKYIIFEPGDHTRYEFIISESPKTHAELEFLFISSGDNSPKFKGYLFRKDSINAFFEKVGNPPENKEKYRKWLGTKIVMEDTYLGYVVSHAGNCNPCTAVAGIVCAYKLLGGQL